MFVVAFLWSEIKSIFIKTQKELGPYQRRIQERGRGGPSPPPIPRPLCLEQTEARTAGKFVFGPPPPSPLPYLKIWICHCISCHLDRTSLVNKRFITWPKRKGFRRTSGRERQVHLSSSGSQSEHRICLTLPAGRVSHIQLIIGLIGLIVGWVGQGPLIK